MLGETWEEATRIPTSQELMREMEKQMQSPRPLFSLGVGVEGDMWITEEERENHFHVLGTTGEGKSKLFEHMIRYDINHGNGLILLDPSAGGKTAYDVLKYCAYKGVKKVVFIDPAHIYSHGKVIGLNPFHYSPSLEDSCVTNIFDVIKIIFNSKDESETPMIAKFLPHLLHVLFKANATLYEALYFTERDNMEYRVMRERIMEKAGYNRFTSFIREIYNPYNPILQGESRSTTRRLEPLFHDIISLSLAKTGLDFETVVRDKYIVLVNLSSYHLQPIHRRLLGTLLLNEIDFAIDRMKSNGWKGKYYMYIDEAGEFATRKISNILALKRKNGLRLITAHQYFSQFEDKYVLDAVNNLTKTKIVFYIPNYEDRMKVVKSLYGGSLPDRDVSYVLGQQKKQHAVIKKGKESATIVKIPFVNDVEADVDSYLEYIYSQPWYFSPKEIRDEINSRFPYVKGEDSVSSGGGNQSQYRPSNRSNGGKKKYSPKGSQPTGKKQPDKGRTPSNVDELFLEDEKIKKTQ